VIATLRIGVMNKREAPSLATGDPDAFITMLFACWFVVAAWYPIAIAAWPWPVSPAVYPIATAYELWLSDPA
jgi:hypothetical protein